jgi:DNA-directed RNA polymerase subunit omega
MARITVEDCLEKEPNRFALVILASRRAKELLGGSNVLIDEHENKQVVTSLREIAAGKVRFMTEAEQRAVHPIAAQQQEVPQPTKSQLDDLEKLFSDPSAFGA